MTCWMNSARDQVGTSLGAVWGSRYAQIIINALGLCIPFLGNIISGAALFDETAAWYRDVERIKRLGNDVVRSRQQVELLSHIRKVAWLSEKQTKK